MSRIVTRVLELNGLVDVWHKKLSPGLKRAFNMHVEEALQNSTSIAHEEVKLLLTGDLTRENRLALERINNEYIFAAADQSELKTLLTESLSRVDETGEHVKQFVEYLKSNLDILEEKVTAIVDSLEESFSANSQLSEEIKTKVDNLLNKLHEKPPSQLPSLTELAAVVPNDFRIAVQVADVGFKIYNLAQVVTPGNVVCLATSLFSLFGGSCSSSTGKALADIARGINAILEDTSQIKRQLAELTDLCTKEFAHIKEALVELSEEQHQLQMFLASNEELLEDYDLLGSEDPVYYFRYALKHAYKSQITMYRGLYVFTWFRDLMIPKMLNINVGTVCDVLIGEKRFPYLPLYCRAIRDYIATTDTIYKDKIVLDIHRLLNIAMEVDPSCVVDLLLHKFFYSLVDIEEYEQLWEDIYQNQYKQMVFDRVHSLPGPKIQASFILPDPFLGLDQEIERPQYIGLYHRNGKYHGSRASMWDRGYVSYNPICLKYYELYGLHKFYGINLGFNYAGSDFVAHGNIFRPSKLFCDDVPLVDCTIVITDSSRGKLDYSTRFTLNPLSKKSSTSYGQTYNAHGDGSYNLRTLCRTFIPNRELAIELEEQFEERIAEIIDHDKQWLIDKFNERRPHLDLSLLEDLPFDIDIEIPDFTCHEDPREYIEKMKDLIIDYQVRPGLPIIVEALTALLSELEID